MTEQNSQKSPALIWFQRIAGLFFLFILVIFVMNFEDILLQSPEQKSAIGMVQKKVGEAKIKSPGDTNWHNLKEKEFIPTQSLILTSADSSVSYILIDGTIINQDANTLLKLHYDIKKLNANDGFEENVGIQLSKGSLKVETPRSKDDEKKNITINENRLNVKDQDSAMTLNYQEESEEINLAIMKGRVGFMCGDDGEVTLNRGDKLNRIEKNSQLTAEEIEPKKEKVPDSLIQEFERKETENNEELQKEFLESRSFKRILSRILRGIL